MTIGLGEATAAAVRARIGVDALRKAKLGPEYSYPSLPLCVIDAVFSIGVRDVNARRAVTAWCEAQHSQWSEDRADGVPARRMRELVRPLAGLSGAERAEKFFGGNRQRTSPKSGILKADAVAHFAEALVEVGIEDFPDLQESGRVARAWEVIATIPGQRSGLSFRYFLMLGGNDDGVKADRMICGFVAAATESQNVSASAAEAAIVAACGILKPDFPNLTPRLLDHLVWQYQRELESSRGQEASMCRAAPEILL